MADMEMVERTWPIAITTGWGFGVAYADAQVIIRNDVNDQYSYSIFIMQRVFHPHHVPGVQFEKKKPVVQNVLPVKTRCMLS